ncbi:MAG: hypothetical protein CME05_15525 [Gemmatimonadaceae bacterium]|nr:hypothetical protein [Gemmatimonadaceae bacterium]|tara:strand:+ start:493 stop:870 length:378 start_codon:yes stop_codon:yes gene_type:complete
MNLLAEHYWQGCSEGKVLYQQCGTCGHVQSYPRPFCTNCGEHEPAWKESLLSGVVGGATTVHRPPSQAFANLVPYRLLLVEMDEGFRIMAYGDMAIQIGAKISVGFKERDGRSFPYCTAAIIDDA